MKLFNPENAHWYRRDGEPLHSVPSAKGEPRPTTLRDARKLGLLPSVTNVLGVINMGQFLARYGAVEFARAEDTWGFLADGSGIDYDYCALDATAVMMTPLA
jgi:hypothetical protein